METVGKKISSGKPTPLDFDAFVPWICLQWQVPEIVIVKRMSQEKYKMDDRKLNSTRSKSTKSLKIKNYEQESDTTKTYTGTIAAPANSIANILSVEQPSDDIIFLQAYYDIRGYLVEVAIINCRFKIHRKVIQAINICVPFHSFLAKLVIRGNSVNFILLYEIGKLLPHSNLSHVCLDDTCVPEGNYFVLLDCTSQLKCLSLNRCDINDNVCKEIAVRIDFDGPAYSSLMVLELSSNLITDIGAQCFGNMLRVNRRLLHLNLTGNKITDKGAKAILKHLMEFVVTGDEIRQSNNRKVNYIEMREVVLEKCTNEAIRRKRDELSTTSTIIRRSKSTKFKKQSLFNAICDQSVTELAEAMTKEIIGEFEDPFCLVSVMKKDERYFSTGNMILCSLNLSYNYLEYPSIKMVADVLKYQCQMTKKGRATGLLRIVLSGNLVPDTYAEYKEIDRCLINMVKDQLPVNLPGRRHS